MAFFLNSIFINFFIFKIKIRFPRWLVVHCNILETSRNIYRNKIDGRPINAIKVLDLVIVAKQAFFERVETFIETKLMVDQLKQSRFGI